MGQDKKITVDGIIDKLVEKNNSSNNLLINYKNIEKEDRWTKKIKKGVGLAGWKFGKNSGRPVVVRDDFRSRKAAPR